MIQQGPNIENDRKTFRESSSGSNSCSNCHRQWVEHNYERGSMLCP